MADDAIPSSASWVQSPDNTPTMEVRPKREEKPAAAGKLTHADMVERWQARGFSKEGAEGIADNMMRESGGDPTIPGDKGTSYGLFQHHAERKAALETFAKNKGADPSDPDVQIEFADHEMKTQMPKLRERLMATKDRSAAEGEFRRVFERPAAGQWESGGALLGNERYRFADTATKEHEDKPNTDLVYMEPQDYLDLSPQLAGKPFANSAGRSLVRSLKRGDAVESVPSLDVDVDGPTATVTDQDGRHRALAAQQAGVTHIPVAINRNGQGQPTEIVGQQGKVLPHRYPTAADVSHETRPDGSIWGSIKSAIIPSAEAAEPTASPNPFDQFDEPKTASGQANPFDQFDAAPAGPSPAAEQPAPSDAGGPLGGIAAAAGRGLAPYAASAGIGAMLGGPPGAAVGAGLAGIGELAHLFGGITPSDITNKLLDVAGVRRPQNMLERMTQTTAAGMGNALTSVRMAETLANTLTNPAARMVAMQLAKRPIAQIISGGTGGASAQIAAEAGAGPVGQMTAGFLGSLVPFAPGAAGRLARINPKEAAKTAIDAGFVLPPAEATEGSVGAASVPNALAGFSGKVKTRQYASAMNQPITNRLAATELELPPDTALTPAAIDAVKERGGQGYAALKAIPTQALDGQFVEDVNAIGKEARAAAAEFPSLKSPEVEAMRTELVAAPTFSTSAMVEKLKRLRFDAKANLQARADPDRLVLGLAQRHAAGAVEDLMERNLAKTGDLAALEAYRHGRALIAKAYDVESATNVSTNDVDARHLGALLDKGKPLTGNLKIIADAANNFPHAFQPAAKIGGVESFSVLDWAAAMAAASTALMHGNIPAAITLGAVPFARPGVRAGIMSGPFQRAMVTPVGPAQGVPMSVFGSMFRPTVKPPQ